MALTSAPIIFDGSKVGDDYSNFTLEYMRSNSFLFSQLQIANMKDRHVPLPIVLFDRECFQREKEPPAGSGLISDAARHAVIAQNTYNAYLKSGARCLFTTLAGLTFNRSRGAPKCRTCAIWKVDCLVPCVEHLDVYLNVPKMETSKLLGHLPRNGQSCESFARGLDRTSQDEKTVQTHEYASTLKKFHWLRIIVDEGHGFGARTNASTTLYKA